jgi:hypothetical protein
MSLNVGKWFSVRLNAAQQEFVRVQNAIQLHEKRHYVQDYMRFFEDVIVTISKSDEVCVQEDCACRYWLKRDHVEISERETDLIRQILYEERITFDTMKRVNMFFVRLEENMDANNVSILYLS